MTISNPLTVYSSSSKLATLTATQDGLTYQLNDIDNGVQQYNTSWSMSFYQVYQALQQGSSAVSADSHKKHFAISGMPTADYSDSLFHHSDDVVKAITNLMQQVAGPRIPIADPDNQRSFLQPTMNGIVYTLYDYSDGVCGNLCHSWTVSPSDISEILSDLSGKIKAKSDSNNHYFGYFDLGPESGWQYSTNYFHTPDAMIQMLTILVQGYSEYPEQSIAVIQNQLGDDVLLLSLSELIAGGTPYQQSLNPHATIKNGQIYTIYTNIGEDYLLVNPDNYWPVQYVSLAIGAKGWCLNADTVAAMSSALGFISDLNAYPSATMAGDFISLFSSDMTPLAIEAVANQLMSSYGYCCDFQQFVVLQSFIDNMKCYWSGNYYVYQDGRYLATLNFDINPPSATASGSSEYSGMTIESLEFSTQGSADGSNVRKLNFTGADFSFCGNFGWTPSATDANTIDKMVCGTLQTNGDSFKVVGYSQKFSSGTPADAGFWSKFTYWDLLLAPFVSALWQAFKWKMGQNALAQQQQQLEQLRAQLRGEGDNTAPDGSDGSDGESGGQEGEDAGDDSGLSGLEDMPEQTLSKAEAGAEQLASEGEQVGSDLSHGDIEGAGESIGDDVAGEAESALDNDKNMFDNNADAAKDIGGDIAHGDIGGAAETAGKTAASDVKDTVEDGAEDAVDSIGDIF